MSGRPLLAVLVALVVGVTAVVVGARSAAADGLDLVSITVAPTAPTEQDEVSITVDGIQYDSCPVISKHAAAGNEISIIIRQEPGSCAQVILDFSVTEQIGSLAPGVYDVLVCEVKGFTFPGQTCASETIAVAESFQVSGVPAVGGVAELAGIDGAPLEARPSGASAGVATGVVAAAVGCAFALVGVAWYARGRSIK